MAASGATLTAAGTLDRVVASMGNVALTQSDVEAEVRFELFLNGQSPQAVPDTAVFERVLERLIDQKLLAQEAEAAKLESAQASRTAAEALAEVRKKYASEEAFQSALRSLGMEEKQVHERLAGHARTLRFIDQRLRPVAWIERAEIEAYYQETLVPQYTRRSAGPAPPLTDVEGPIREILVQKKIDQLLEMWLAELKSSLRVRVHSF